MDACALHREWFWSVFPHFALLPPPTIHPQPPSPDMAILHHSLASAKSCTHHLA